MGVFQLYVESKYDKIGRVNARGGCAAPSCDFDDRPNDLFYSIKAPKARFKVLKRRKWPFFVAMLVVTAATTNFQVSKSQSR